MKIKSLLIVAMCAISFGAFAQTTTLYIESFSTEGYKDTYDPQYPCGTAAETTVLTANSNAAIAAYKPASGNFYHDEGFKIHSPWDTGTATYPGASGGAALHLEPPTYGELSISLNTSSFSYASFTMAHAIRTWGGDAGNETSQATVYYSYDNGANWLTMSKAAAKVTKNGVWDYVEFSENIGGKTLITIRVLGTGTGQFDDFMVTGTNAVVTAPLVNAIAAAEAFLAAANPIYCYDGIAAAITAAKEVAADSEATQAEIDEEAAALNIIVANSKAAALNFAAANEALTASDEVYDNLLYLFGASALKTAFTDAATALSTIVSTGKIADACATQAQVDAAVLALTNAIAAIEAQALDFTDAGTAVSAAEAFKLTAEYTIWSAEVTAAFDQALTELKAVIAANGIVSGQILTAAELAVFVTALEDAQQTLIGVDGTAIEGISITSSQIILPAAADIQIYSASGALVLSIYADQVNIAGLPAGVYVVKSNGASASFVK